MTARPSAAIEITARLLALALAVAPIAEAAVVEIVSADAAGEGLNDPTPRNPIGGNSGTTLGEQRRIVLENAAAVWGGLLDSSIPIVVQVRFDPLFCEDGSATLGSAGAESVFRDFDGAPRARTWYVGALADSLAGVDLDPGQPDISVQMNSSLDLGCLGQTEWYYGLDGAANRFEIDFWNVVLHELAHGLGFLTLVDPTSGRRLMNVDDAFQVLLEDHSRGASWTELSNAQRSASSIDSGDLHFTGARVVGESGALTSGVGGSGHVEMYAPDPVEPGSSVSHFSTSLSPDELMEPFLVADAEMTTAIAALADLGWRLRLETTPTSVPSPTATHTAPATPTPPRTATPTATGPTASPRDFCVGDCDGDQVVSISELVKAVGIALGDPAERCPASDADDDGRTAISDLVIAVDGALHGCP